MARKSLSEELKEKTSSASTKAKWPDTFFKDILDGMQLPDIRNAIITSSRRMGKSMTVMDEMMPMFHGQSMGRSMRPMRNPASEIYIDSIPSIMPWHCFRSENKKSLDPADLFKSLDRSLRGQTPDVSAFKARIRSQEQLSLDHKRSQRLAANLSHKCNVLEQENMSLRASYASAKEDAEVYKAEAHKAGAEIERLRGLLERRDRLESATGECW